MKRLTRIKHWRKKDLPLDKMQLQQGEGSESFQWMISVHVISDFVIFLQAMYTNNHFKEGKKEKRKKKEFRRTIRSSLRPALSTNQVVIPVARTYRNEGLF